MTVRGREFVGAIVTRPRFDSRACRARVESAVAQDDAGERRFIVPEVWVMKG